MQVNHKRVKKKKQHIKKPLNAFMLFMKEMRPKVVAECTLKESAAINQILGRKVSPIRSEKQTQPTLYLNMYTCLIKNTTSASFQSLKVVCLNF